MKVNLSRREESSLIDIDLTVRSILKVQKTDGEIPWSNGGKTDPWDHVENAMGLSVAGYLKEAELAYEWSFKMQNEDGSWLASYKNGKPSEMRKDANMSAYIAVGVLHHYLISNDVSFLKKMWSSVCAAIEFIISLQAPTGEIYWSVAENNIIEQRALLTGSSSMYMSIKCALAIASYLGKTKPRWEFANKKLSMAIRKRPHLFDNTKSRYSMDWFYPILSGAITGNEAKHRIEKYWDKFVVEKWGIKCVSDQPWVTMAETSELVLALAAIGDFERAALLFDWIKDKKDEDGTYWTGVTYPDNVIWPEERTTWTAAVILLANDALYDLTPASRLFSHNYWK